MNAQFSAITGTTKPGECGVYVVDAAKGTVIYRATVPGVTGPSGVGGVCDVKASLAENWLVYHYYDDDFSGQGQTKGWRMVSVELYEGKGIDDKTMRYVSFWPLIHQYTAHSGSIAPICPHTQVRAWM
jgi:hypothetical protein